MEIYFFILVLFAFEVLVGYEVGSKRINVVLLKKYVYSTSATELYEKCVLLFDFMILFLLAVFRDINVGSDYVSYMSIFSAMVNVGINNVSSSYFWTEGEVGFAFLGTLIGSIFDEPLWIVCVCYLVILGGVFRFIKKYSKNILISLFLFFAFSFYNMSYNILRQYIAAVILLQAVDYIKRDFIRFFCVVALAAVFHKTALIFLVLYPVLKYANDIRIASIFFLMIISVFALYAEQILYFLGENVAYSSYVNDTQSGGLINVLVMGMIFFLYFIFAKRIENKDSFGKVWISMSVIAFSISLFSVQIHPFNRLLLYFLMPAMVSLVNFLNAVLSEKSIKSGELILMVMFILYYSYLLCYTSVYQTVPYSSKILGV